MNSFRFGNPWLLFLLIPLLAGVLLGFFLMKKKKRYTKRNIISFSLHLLLAVVVAFTFSDPQFLKVDSGTEVYILADASASERPSTSRMDAAIAKVREEASKMPGTKTGVIAFAKNCKVLAEPGERFSTLSDVYDDEEFDYTASDIENALTFAAERFDDDAIKRIVLISDGEQTDGSAVDALETLIQEGIQVDAIDLDADFPSEVSVTGLEYTDSAYLNRDEIVKATINASEPTNAQVTLFKDGVQFDSRAVYLGNGVNVVSFSLDTSEAGSFTYRIEVTAQEGQAFMDSFVENNSRSFVQNVTADFSILFIGTRDTQLSEFQRLGGFTEDTDITSYIDTDEIPYTLEDLIQYDEIVLADIDLTKEDNYQEFIDNLTTAVQVYGKSVFTFDGTHVGNTNDPALVKYNDLLPVQYQPDDTRALVLLIDSSASMGGNNIDMAIQGAKAVVDDLDVHDSIAVVTFDSEVAVPVSMTTIRNEANRKDIKDKIDRITVEGGTNMIGGLRESYNQIEGVTAEYKNIITLTDGLPGDNVDELQQYVTSISFSNISCSFLNIGEVAGEDILKTLARLGNGKYYFIDSSFEIQDIMIDAIDQEVVNAIIEKESDIIYVLKDDPSLQGGIVDNLGTISGYNYCRTKSGAQTVLTVQYIHTDSENKISVIAIPLYAYWDFGKGKVSSFTSSLDTSWTSRMRSSAAGQKFFGNIVAQSLPDRFNRSVLDVSLTSNGSTSNIVVTPNIETSNTSMSIQVTERGTSNSIDYNLNYDGESFKGVIATPEVGIYDMMITYSRLNPETGLMEIEETLNRSFSFDFSSEFNFFEANENNLLYQLADQGGGKLIPEGNIQLEISDEQLAATNYKSGMLWFLVAAVVIFLVDIFVRKTNFKKKGKKDQNTSQEAAQQNYF